MLPELDYLYDIHGFYLAFYGSWGQTYTAIEVYTTTIVYSICAGFYIIVGGYLFKQVNYKIPKNLKILAFTCKNFNNRCRN